MEQLSNVSNEGLAKLYRDAHYRLRKSPLYRDAHLGCAIREEVARRGAALPNDVLLNWTDRITAPHGKAVWCYPRLLESTESGNAEVRPDGTVFGYDWRVKSVNPEARDPRTHSTPVERQVSREEVEILKFLAMYPVEVYS